MPPLLAVPSLETAACLGFSRLLVQAFSKLESKKELCSQYLGDEPAGSPPDEKEVEDVLDSLPAALLERATQQALVLLTSDELIVSGIYRMPIYRTFSYIE